MLLKTPKEKSMIWVAAIAQFFLIPINNWFSEKIMLDTSDFSIEGASATRVLVGSVLAILIISPFVIAFVFWTLKNYHQEISLFNFNQNRIWWSLFWTLLVADWIYIEVVFFIKFFDEFYFPEALNLIQSGLMIYLFLYLRTSIISKNEKFKLDNAMACFSLIFTVIIQTLLFL